MKAERRKGEKVSASSRTAQVALSSVGHTSIVQIWMIDLDDDCSWCLFLDPVCLLAALTGELDEPTGPDSGSPFAALPGPLEMNPLDPACLP